MIKIKHNIVSVVIIFVMTTLFSCQPKQKKTAQVIEKYKDAPAAVGLEINLKYTDSGRLAAILRAPRLLNYTNKIFGYYEFPDGLTLDMIDKEGRVSVIKADYAISYQHTGLIDMRENVDINTADSTHVMAQQLFWDQSINWVFTDLPYKSYLPDGTINEADGFDANQDFTILNSRTNEGIMVIKE